MRSNQYCIKPIFFYFIFSPHTLIKLVTQTSHLRTNTAFWKTQGAAVKQKIKYCTKQHGMTDTEVWHFRNSLCKCLYKNTSEKVIHFSFNQKCSSFFFFYPTSISEFYCQKGENFLDYF